MRKINKLVIHCAATPPDMDIGVAEIRRWHVGGNKWQDIGYHFVVRRDGTVENGRPVAVAGAHAKGHNANSIGICLVGGIDAKKRPENNFTPAQWASLEGLVRDLKAKYNIQAANIIGHNQVAKKACPCFDVPQWRTDRRI